MRLSVARLIEAQWRQWASYANRSSTEDNNVGTHTRQRLDYDTGPGSGALAMSTGHERPVPRNPQ